MNQEYEYKISKELFEAVMEVELYVDKAFEYKLMPNLAEYGVSYNDFFFKCKEWASADFMLSSNNYCSCHIYDGGTECIKSFLGRSEQQAVFDACQWILKETK
jgi:hypothetical protein